MNKTKLAYIAGFFDGEGCVCIHHRGDQQKLEYFMDISIVQKGNLGRQVFEKFQNIFEGQIYYRKQGQYVWGLGSRVARRFLEQVLPYLQIKKQQAELAIEFQKRLSKNIGKHHYSEIERIELYGYRETVRQEMMFLNRTKIK